MMVAVPGLSSSASNAASIAAGASHSSGNAALAHLHILKVTQSYYPFLERGGSAVQVRALAQGLARKGHSVCVLTSDLGIASVSKQAVSFARTPLGWRSDDAGVEAIYLSTCGSYRSLTWNPGVDEFCVERLRSFDLVHIYGTYDLLGPAVAGACRRNRIPYILETMGMFRPIVRNVALKWVYRRLFGEALVRGAAAVVATSVQERRELIEEGIPSEKIVIRRNGIELPELPTPGTFRREWKIPDDVLVVLFLGRISRKKSPDLLLEAFARWRHSGQIEHSLLVIAGPYEDARYGRQLQALAKRLALETAVLFTGPLYDEAKWSAFLDADLFVLPSQNENFGNAAAESVACGTPVVVTDQCGVAPLIEGRAGLVIPYECEALAGALHQLADPALRARFKSACLNMTHELDWEQPLAETEALYAQLQKRSSTTDVLSLGSKSAGGSSR